MTYRVPQDPRGNIPERRPSAADPAQQGGPVPAHPARQRAGSPAADREEQGRLVLSMREWDGRLPPPRGHIAVVLVYRHGDHEVLFPDNRHRSRLLRRPVMVYEVDVGLHRVQIRDDLPSNGDIFYFHAVIDVQSRVIDPSAVVRNSALSLRGTVTPDLKRRLRDITRNFEISQPALAEYEINRLFSGTTSGISGHGGQTRAGHVFADENIGAEYGLWIRVIASLTVDDTAIEHGGQLRQLDHEIQVEQKTQKLRQLQEANQNDLRAARISMYKEIINAGDMDRFALMLASNPDDVRAVDAIIREEEANRRSDTVRFVADMVDSGVIEPWEVSEQARQTLQWLKRATTRVLRTEPRQELEAAAPRRRRGRDEPAPEDDAGDVVDAEVVSDGPADRSPAAQDHV